MTPNGCKLMEADIPGSVAHTNFVMDAAMNMTAEFPTDYHAMEAGLTVAPTAGLEPATCATAYLLTLIAEASREVLREPASVRDRALAGLAELLAERLPRLVGAHLSEGVG